MLTPQEVENAVFPKSGLGSGGYKMSSVDEFLDKVTEDYKTLYSENITLKAKLKVLAEKAEEYRMTESAIHTTLLTAQQTANSIVKDAETRKAKVLIDARKEAGEQIEQIESEIKDVQDRLSNAQGELADFISRSTALCETQMQFLTKLSKLVAKQAETKVITEPVTAPVSEPVSIPVVEETKEPEQQKEEQEAEEGKRLVEDLSETAIYKGPLVDTEKQDEEKTEQSVIEEIGKGVEQIIKEDEKANAQGTSGDIEERLNLAEGEFTRSLKELEWHFGKNVDITKE